MSISTTGNAVLGRQDLSHLLRRAGPGQTPDAYLDGLLDRYRAASAAGVSLDAAEVAEELWGVVTLARALGGMYDRASFCWACDGSPGAFFLMNASTCHEHSQDMAAAASRAEHAAREAQARSGVRA